MKEYRRRVKAQVFDAYGRSCACCGEAEELFLDIDHMDNDGAAHFRKHKLSAGNMFYVWLVKNNFPSNFQTLCCNCNRGKFRNGGVCPHKETLMSGKNEMSRPEHTIHDMNIHHSHHGHMDQKLHKGMRSPMASQLPLGNGEEAKVNESGAMPGDDNFGGGM